MKKQNEWIWTEEHTRAFNSLKECITKIPCLAHYNAQSENIITTDASSKGLGATLWQKQKTGELKPIGFASRFLSDTEKKNAINDLELLAVVLGLEHFRLYIHGKPIELLTDHQALEPLIKRNRSNKTYSARLTRWLDRLAHFNINIKHIAGKHLALTDYLSRNPTSMPEPIENYDEEYVNNCITALFEFNHYGSITGKMNKEARTDDIEKFEQKFNQSESSKRNEPKSKLNKTNKRSSLLPQLNTVDRNTINNVKHNYGTIMDIRGIEQIEADDPSEETLQLVNRWKELVKPGEYRTSKGSWKKYNPPRHHRAEIKRIEMNSNQRRNRMLWNRMEEQDKEPEDNTTKREELFRVIEKIRNMPKNQDEGQPETRDNTTEVENQPETNETASISSADLFDVPAINFKRYVGTTGVRYIQMGQASHIQGENKWNLDKTIRQAEQKFTTDLKTIATETTNDEKLLKTSVCLERRTLEQIPDDYKPYHKQLSTRFGVVFYDDRIIIPKSLRTTIIMLLHKGHATINKMTTAAKPFWWPRMTREIQQKCDECIPCKMAGKNIKPQSPMTEINYLPPVEKTNQEIQLDFIGPIRFKHRRFYILLSIDRYSRWPAACICEAPSGKTAKHFLEQYITLNG